jgi:type I restriction-modification system DNA methylase subunit
LIFKFLSDLEVLEKEFRFASVYEMSKSQSEKALTFYANNSRKQIYNLFPPGKDGTTIINGTIFVNEQGEPNLSQAVLFYHSLKHLYEYEINFGSFIKIDKSFKTKLYETFLKQEVEALGQYFTTRKIVQSIVRMSRLDEEEFGYEGKRICDPFCGVGGFLLEILNLNEKMKRCYIPDENGKINVPFVLEGFDKGFEREDERTIILAKANMLIYLTDVIFKNPKLTQEFAEVFNETFTLFRDNLATFQHIIAEDKNKYDYILTNPPYVTRGASIIKEEIKSKGLSKYYPVNAFGLEGLAIEWVIRSLSNNGKAFIIVPDGVMERSGDKKLRSHILKECYLDAIISLPVRTFYANFRKTYILALTKKKDVNDAQKHGVFTYLVSNIGEDLTKKNRDEINNNDLPEMEKLFAMYSAIKDDHTAYPLINSQRCKLLTINELSASKHWRVEKWWSEEELKKLGLLEEEIELKTIIGSLDNAKVFIDKLIKSEGIPIDTGSVLKLQISDLFIMSKGSADYTRKWIKTHSGDYRLYSSKTNNDGIIGMIDKYDYDVKQCLTWTTDGVYAGTVFLREGKFSMTSHCGALMLKDKLDGSYSPYDIKGIYLPYVYHILKNKLRKSALGQEHQNKRVTVDVIKGIEIEIPIIDDKTFDKTKQQEIAIQFDKSELAFDEAMQAKNELILTLQKGLGK